MKNKILTIDDAFENNRLIELYFRKEYEVFSASSGFKGLEMLLEVFPDVILLDIMMPGIDGYKVLEKIAGDYRTKDIPVIMVSAKPEREDVKKALKLGAFDYIKKPVDFSELSNKLNLALKTKKQSEQLRKYESYYHIHEGMIHARRIQVSFMPDKQTFKNLFPESFKIDIPRDIVSGDFYWAGKTNQKTVLGLFDATGHGVPGAMLSVLGYSLLNEFILHKNIDSPEVIFNMLSREISFNLNQNNDTYTLFDGMDGILCFLDKANNTLNFSSAQRPIVLIRKTRDFLIVDDKEVKPVAQKDDRCLFVIKGERRSLGNESVDVLFKNRSVQITDSDIIYIFSDGITDQMGGASGKRYTIRQLFNLLLSIQNKDMQNQKAIIYNELKKWSSSINQTDDILFIAFKCFGELDES